jgi:DNA invertase Pin-like site-specific DNA recombinase
MTTCAIYIRKSREDKDRQSHRLTVQREQLPAHALAQGWTPLIYDDGHASAARGKTADLLQRARLEADINAGKINLILCLELSRLSRDDSLQDYVAWLDLCGRHRVKLATPSRILDPGQNSDWMLLLMEGGFSSVEMRTLTARMLEGREQARAVGKYLGGSIPWPYVHSRELKQPVIDPEQLPRFRQAIEMLQTHSIVHINRVLDLPRDRLNRIFHEERIFFYLAQRIIDDKTITCDWPPVITADEAASLRALRKSNQDHCRKPDRPGGLLSGMGIFLCGECGGRIQSGTYKAGYHRGYYYCAANQNRTLCHTSRRILRDHVDPFVVEHLLTIPARLADLKAYWQQSQNRSEHGKELLQIETEIDTLHQKMARLINAIADGVITTLDARDKRTEINTAINILKAKSTKIRNEIITPEWDDLILTPEDWPLLTHNEQREYIASIVDHLTLTHDDIAITYRFPLDRDGLTTETIRLPGRRARKPVKNRL